MNGKSSEMCQETLIENITIVENDGLAMIFIN